MILVDIATRRGTPTITSIITIKKDVMELSLKKDTHNCVEWKSLIRVPNKLV